MSPLISGAEICWSFITTWEESYNVAANISSSVPIAILTLGRIARTVNPKAL